jgi:hypothetical protein
MDVLIVSFIIGVACYHFGYSRGIKKENKRLCNLWDKEKREDNK